MVDTTRVAKREWVWVLCWGLVFLAATSLPYLAGVLASTPETQFGGLVYNVLDGNSYIAKMRQGARGEWLFTLPYTSEPHRGAFVYPFYLWLGKFAAASGLSLIAAYHLARLLCALFLLVNVYAFLARFTCWLAIRRIAFLLALFSAGAGWLLMLLGLPSWLGDMPIDFWVQEGYLFLLSYATPHLAFAGGLLFALLALVIDAWRQDSWRLTVLSGAVGLLLTTILPFYAATGYLVLGATWLVESLWRKKARWGGKLNRRRLAMLFISGLFTLPMLAYQLVVFLADPFFSAWAAQNLTPSPHIAHYVLGYVFLIPLAAGGAVWIVRRGDRQNALPLAWLIVTPLLVYLPVNFQRRFLIGYQVPLSLLAAWGLARYVLLPFSRSRAAHWLLRWPRYSLPGLRKWAIAALVVFLSATHILLLIGNSVEAWARPDRMFHTRAELEAMDWLGGHTLPDEAVLCAFDTGNFIPARTGNRVFLGHGPETVRSEEKKALAARFFDAQTDNAWRQSLLSEYQLDYVVVGPRERALGAFAADQATFLSQVYANDDYAIYRVELD